MAGRPGAPLNMRTDPAFGNRALLAALCLLLAGCYAPVRSEGIPARELSPACRKPPRTAGIPLNYSSLIAPPPAEYLLGAGDLLEISAPDLISRGDARPFQVQVLGTGEIHLPRVGPVQVAGLSLGAAQSRVNSAMASGFLRNPGATVTLVQKATANVLVLGAVQNPGVHPLPRYENDVAHALGAAGGFTEDAGDVIEVHRSFQSRTDAPVNSSAGPGWPVPSQAPRGGDYRMAPQAPAAPAAPRSQPSGGQPALPFPTTSASPYGSYRSAAVASPAGSVTPPLAQTGGTAFPAPHSENITQASWATPPVGPGPLMPQPAWQPGPQPVWQPGPQPVWQPGARSAISVPAEPVTRIPLRGDGGQSLRPADVTLGAGDVVVVPRRRDEVFFVVGPLSQTNRVRFSVGSQDREIGSGFMLPEDREIDVVTAVAMAGYIDPIDSPTTVTVHRTMPEGTPLLIRVDLIKARTDPEETVFVQPGDIIYLNPDAWWYSRRLFDHLIRGALGDTFGRWLVN